MILNSQVIGSTLSWTAVAAVVGFVVVLTIVA